MAPASSLSPGPTLRQLLLIDHDRTFASALGDFLQTHGYQMAWAENPSAAAALLSRHPDLILLDALGPERDGFEVCKGLRASGNQTPIIMLAPSGDDLSCVQGLRLGADDFLAKPFNPLVLLARIEAVLRRSLREPGPKTDGLQLDAKRKTLLIEGREVALTLSEYRLLAGMMGAPGSIFSRKAMLGLLGDADELGTSDRAIDIHVSRLRTKLESDPRRPRHLLTVRGVGYRFEG